MKEMLYKLEKKIRGSIIEIYKDLTIVIQSKTSKYGMNVPASLYNWVKLPKNKKDKDIEIIADFEFFSTNEDLQIIPNVACIIYHNNYTGFIRPKTNTNNEGLIRDEMRKKAKLKCVIHGKDKSIDQLIPTEKFNQAKDLRNRLKLPKIETLECITYGKKQKSSFQILQDYNNNIYLNCRGIMDGNGIITLSDEIGRYIEDWFEKEKYCLCLVNKKDEMVLKLNNRKRTSRPNQRKKELNIPYYGEKKVIEILFTLDDIKLTNQARMDMIYKKRLISSGFDIDLLKVNFSNGEHYNSEIEKRFREFLKLIENQNEKIELLTEVELTLSKNKIEKNRRNKFCFDSMTIYQKDGIDYLLLIELKTSLCKSNRYRYFEIAIANLLYFTRKIGKEKVVPILITNEPMLLNGKSSSVDFCKKCGIILLDLVRVEELEKNLELFLEEINNFIENIEYQQNNSIPSLINKPQRIGNWKTVTEGTSFEREILSELKKEFEDIESNIFFRWMGKKIEIDHLVKDTDSVIMVSCKNRSKTKLYERALQRINESLNIIEFRKDFLQFTDARLYVKIHPDLKDRISERFHHFITKSNVQIYIK